LKEKEQARRAYIHSRVYGSHVSAVSPTDSSNSHFTRVGDFWYTRCARFVLLRFASLAIEFWRQRADSPSQEALSFLFSGASVNGTEASQRQSQY